MGFAVKEHTAKKTDSFCHKYVFLLVKHSHLFSTLHTLTQVGIGLT